jgi:hypothetical protein
MCAMDVDYDKENVGHLGDNVLSVRSLGVTGHETRDGDEATSETTNPRNKPRSPERVRRSISCEPATRT